MRKILLLTLTLFFFQTVKVWAQAPEGINYQAVARDISGAEMPNTPVNVRLEILDAGLATIYQEDHSTTTNAFGLFNVVIGQGANPTAVFSNINWANGPFYLRVNIDANASGYVNMGYTQLWSVPYALYAKTAANGPQGLPGLNCWDTDGDGVTDATEDRNGDGQWNALDCQGDTGVIGATGPTGQQGAQGPTGASGLNCWDLDGDGVNDPNEDVNSDTQWNALDCIGATGPTGTAGAAGPTGPQGVQGPSGSQGLQGPTGAQGLQGPTGAQGVQGPTGAQGAQGPTGTFAAAGTLTQTLYHNGTTWTPTSALTHDGFYTGIGTAPSTSARLAVDWSSNTANVATTYTSMASSASGNNMALNAAIGGTGTGNYYGLYGQGNNASGSGTVYGVWGVGYGSGTGVRYGVYGAASIQAVGQTGYGVYATVSGLSGNKYALYADATGSGGAYAGWFAGGDVHVTNNVSIGTTSNSERLTVADQTSTTSTSAISIIGGTNGIAAIAFGNGNNAYLGEVRYDNSTNSMHFWTGNTYRMVLDGNGNLGIGNNFTAPQSQLHMHAAGVTQMQLTNSNTGSGAGDGFVLGLDNASTVALTNQEGGGIKLKDGANSPLWASGACVGINSPAQPLYSFLVYNNLSHLAFEVGYDQTAIGDINNNSGGNYLWIDHTAANAKFMFLGANTAFGTTASPSSTVFIQGGSTASTTYALKIQNSTNTVHFAVRDDGKTGIGVTPLAPTSTLDVSGSFALSNQVTLSTISATHTVTADQSVIFVSANTITVTLPAASSCKGRMIWIKQTVAFINTSVTSLGGNVEGVGTYSISSSGSRRACMFMSDGANWWMMTTIL